MAENTTVEDLKAPLLAAVGAADLALATVNEIVVTLRERAEEARTDASERAEESRAKLTARVDEARDRLTKLQSDLPKELGDLRERLSADELRKVADAGNIGAQRFLSAFTKAGDLVEGLRARPVVEKRYAGRPDDVVAQAEMLYKSSRLLTLTQLALFHAEVGGIMSLESIKRTMLGAGWCLDGAGWNELVPRQVYLTGELWPKYDRAAARPLPGQQGRRPLQKLHALQIGRVHEPRGHVLRADLDAVVEYVDLAVGEAAHRESRR